MTLAFAITLASSCAARTHERAVVPEHAGCREQLKDGTCILERTRKLVVITPERATVHWSTDVGTVEVEKRAELVDGVRETLVLAPGATLLEGSTGADRGVSYKLRLSQEPLLPVFEEALSLRAKGEFARATQLVQGAEGLSAADQVRRTFVLGRIALAQGDVDRARPLLWQAAQAAHQAGLTSVAVDAANGLGYAEAQLAHAPQAAERALAFAREHAAQFGEGMAIARYTEAYTAAERGDLRESLARLGEAVRVAERLDMGDLLRSASDERANVLARLGRYEEARAAHEKLLAQTPDDDLCTRARLLGNAGWNAMMALGEGEGERTLRDAAHELLTRAAQAADRCDNAQRRTNAHLNLALLSLRDGDAREAQSQLALAEAAKRDDAYTAPWKLEAKGRLALLQKQAEEAARLFERELALAAASGDDEARWRALVGRARAETMDARLNEAADTFAEAEHVLDRLAWAVPLGAGRGMFLDARNASSDGLVSALLSLGEHERAHRALRHALARSEALVAAGDLSSHLPERTRAEIQALLEQHHSARNQLAHESENDWSLSDEALARVVQARASKVEASNDALDRALALATAHLPRHADGADSPAPGTLHLSFMPLGGDLVAFAETSEATRGLRLGPLAEQGDLGRQLLWPFLREIHAAQRIELRTAGALRELDLHALEVDGRPLLAHAPVAYAVESAHGGARRAGERVLVIADPSNVLPHARREGSTVAEKLRQHTQVTLLEGAQATRAAVLSALPESALVHFAGHGRLGNTGPLDQRLELAENHSLAMSDVLALTGVPRNVVLSACDAGSAPERSDVPRALGIAQAFVARGAEAVIAPVRPVNDGASEELMTRLYAHYQHSHDLVLALRDVQISLAEQAEDTTWKSFRAWVR